MFKLFSCRGWFLSKVALLLGCLGFASGCGPGFEPGSEVKTLRVFALQKDAPYPSPGQTVNVSLLWQDAKGARDPMGENVERPVQIAWAPPCVNPGNDVYYGCFPQFAEHLPEFFIGDAREHSTRQIQVPPDIVATHTPPAPGQPSYGLVYSFFALCAGTLVPEPPKEQGGLPLFCKDGDKYLGTDDFVVGYAGIYVFADPEVKNQNPLLKGLQVEGKSYLSQSADPDSPVCIGRECVPDGPVPPLGEVDCAATPDLCFPACADDGGDNCPDIHVHPIIDPPAERDDVSVLYYGHEFSEQMWVSYYADGGNFSGDTRLLNDAEKGWAEDDAATLFRAPKSAGPVTLWVVAHDNRGGVDWARIRLGIR